MEALWEKLLFWKKKQNPKLNKDYQFHHFENTDLTGIRLLTGDYREVVYFYGRVGIEELGEVASLKFDYEIHDAGKHTVESLQSDEKFVTLIGDILRELLINGQTRTINTEEPNL